MTETSHSHESPFVRLIDMGLGELDQIRHVLERTREPFADYATDDFWNVVDGYTSPEPLQGARERIYQMGVRHMEDDAHIIAKTLFYVDNQNDDDYYLPNLEGAFYSILEQCGIEFVRQS